ncbi:MAG TPA: family 20 glycosylhydrolase [Catalimonadaceae bacterium]|nr:family 20 glycosylhydrolase [Catalimonadaceae bacterium]
MKRIFLFILLAGLNFRVFSFDIVPKPKSETIDKAICGLNPTWKWMVGSDSSEAIQKVYGQFQTWADTMAFGYFKPLVPYGKEAKAVKIQLVKDVKIGSEGYQLQINREEILLTAPTVRGVFYGLQSLKQLVFPLFKQEKKFTCGTILDEPRFGWRGMHLDVSRHFFTVKEVEAYLDILALHKMNVFHWHLTDDQGWRLEIKAYPKLTEIGAWRPTTMNGHYRDKPRTFDGKRHGGFYTQEEVRQVVQYAAERMITVVPEIEMPGHCQEMIAAYPELASKDTNTEVMTVWGGTDHILNPYPSTFRFLKKCWMKPWPYFPQPLSTSEAMKP